MIVIVVVTVAVIVLIVTVIAVIAVIVIVIVIVTVIYEVRKGTNGVSPHGVTAQVACFDEGLFGTPVDFIFPKMPGHTFFSTPATLINYFRSGPISVDPICPQPRLANKI